MGIQVGDTWRGLTAELVSAVHPQLTMRLFEIIHNLSADAIVAWSQAGQDSIAFGNTDAELLIAARPFQTLEDIIAVPGIGLDKASILVRAAVTEEAANPANILSEEVYCALAFDGVEVLALRRVSVPDAGSMCRLEVQSAYVSLEGHAETIEIQPIVRQRDVRDTWAEFELDHRQRIWMMAFSGSLLGAVTTDRLLLFPHMGRDFLKMPTTSIQITAPLEQPPASALATDHEFFGFPEIEGDLFMMRTIEPPDPEVDENGAPVLPGWPQSYRFHAEDGDIIIFGPSFPEDVLVGAGGKEPLYRHSGVLTTPERSRNLTAELQTVLDDVQKREDGNKALLLTATSRRSGRLSLGLELDVHAIVDRFADGAGQHEVELTPGKQSVELSITLPAVGEPTHGSAAILGRIANRVVEQELGARDAATGDDRIGVRLSSDVAYEQTFVAAADFSMTALDIRVANALEGTRLVVTVVSDETSVDAELELQEVGRIPLWLTVPLAKPILLTGETTHTIKVTLTNGKATWLCGLGDEIHHLQRVEALEFREKVVDVTDGMPLTGQLRLRRDVPLMEPDIQLSLEPGDHSIELEELTTTADGSFQATMALLPALQQLSERETRLRVTTRSEGQLTLRALDIGYRFRLESD